MLRRALEMRRQTAREGWWKGIRPHDPAQQAEKIPRVGVVTFGKAASDTPADQGFRQGLRDLAYS